MSKRKKKGPRDAGAFFNRNKARQQNQAYSKNSADQDNGKKIKLFYHGDSPKVNTGFGIVAREVLGRLYKTGKYEIHSLGINDRGDTSKHFEAPGIYHYSVPDYQNDPYGIHKMQYVLPQLNPDVIFTLNDIWVLTGSDRNGTKDWFIGTIKKFCPYTPWVLYFPVDSRPFAKEWADLAYTADKTIVYSEYAIDVLKEVYPEKDPILIPHGVSLERFKILPDKERKEIREQFGLGNDKFFVGFVSRNQPRKNPAAAIEIFKMANDGYRKCSVCSNIYMLHEPKCEYCGASAEDSEKFDSVLEHNGVLYLHCSLTDSMGLNLHKVIQDTKSGDRIIVRPHHDVGHGVSDQEFTSIINALDCHLLPTTAEGFGLTVIETMACGVPNICTRTTAVTEQLKDNRGWLVDPYGHWIFDDISGTRKYLIDREKAVLALKELYDDWKNRGENRWGPHTKEKVSNGLKYCEAHTWDMAAKMFDKEIMDSIESRVRISSLYSKGDIPRALFVRRVGGYGDILNTIPSIKELHKNVPNIEIAYAMPNDKVDLFKGRYDFIKNIVPIEKITDKSKEPTENIRIGMYDMLGPEIRWEEATYPFVDKSRTEIYAMHLSLPNPNITLDESIFPFTEEELKYAEDKKEEFSDKFTVCLITESTEPRKAWGQGEEYWDSLAELLNNPKLNINVIKVKDTKNFAKDLAMMKYCNLVITTDNSFLPFLAAHNIRTMAIVSPFWITSRTKDHGNCIVIANTQLTGQGQQEPRYGHEYNPYLTTITYGEVAANVLSEKILKEKMATKNTSDMALLEKGIKND